MDKADSGKRKRRRGGSGVGWLFLGALLGAVLAAGAVIVASEIQHEHGLRRLRRRRGMDSSAELPDEMDLVEGLTHVVSEGFSAMADAAAKLGDSFSGARREQVRFGLEAEGRTAHGASTHGWYYADDDDDDLPLEASVLDNEPGTTPPLPS